MDNFLIKKDNYEIVERINSYSLIAKKDDKKYLIYDFSDNLEGFSDFKFAHKRFKSAGINIPLVYVIDKKNHRAAIEYIEENNMFDEIRDHDLDENIIEQLFLINYRARINDMRLDFDPHNFIYKDNKLIYTPFTFTKYNREEDFTQKEIRLWFYTTEFKNKLIELGLPIDQSRIKNEYERNKEIVLLVVKYFR